MALSDLLEQKAREAFSSAAAEEFFDGPHTGGAQSVSASGSFMIGAEGQEREDDQSATNANGVVELLQASLRIQGNIFDSVENINKLMERMIAIDGDTLDVMRDIEREDLGELENRLEDKKDNPEYVNLREKRKEKEDGGGILGMLAGILVPLLGMVMPLMLPVIAAATIGLGFLFKGEINNLIAWVIEQKFQYDHNKAFGKEAVKAANASDKKVFAKVEKNAIIPMAEAHKGAEGGSMSKQDLEDSKYLQRVSTGKEKGFLKGVNARKVGDKKRSLAAVIRHNTGLTYNPSRESGAFDKKGSFKTDEKRSALLDWLDTAIDSEDFSDMTTRSFKEFRSKVAKMPKLQVEAAFLSLQDYTNKNKFRAFMDTDKNIRPMAHHGTLGAVTAARAGTVKWRRAVSRQERLKRKNKPPVKKTKTPTIKPPTTDSDSVPADDISSPATKTPTTVVINQPASTPAPTNTSAAHPTKSIVALPLPSPSTDNANAIRSADAKNMSPFDVWGY